MCYSYAQNKVRRGSMRDVLFKAYSDHQPSLPVRVLVALMAFFLAACLLFIGVIFACLYLPLLVAKLFESPKPLYEPPPPRQ